MAEKGLEENKKIFIEASKNKDDVRYYLTYDERLEIFGKSRYPTVKDEDNFFNLKFLKDYLKTEKEKEQKKEQKKEQEDILKIIKEEEQDTEKYPAQFRLYMLATFKKEQLEGMLHAWDKKDKITNSNDVKDFDKEINDRFADLEILKNAKEGIEQNKNKNQIDNYKNQIDELKNKYKTEDINISIITPNQSDNAHASIFTIDIEGEIGKQIKNLQNAKNKKNIEKDLNQLKPILEVLKSQIEEPSNALQNNITLNSSSYFAFYNPENEKNLIYDKISNTLISKFLRLAKASEKEFLDKRTKAIKSIVGLKKEMNPNNQSLITKAYHDEYEQDIFKDLLKSTMPSFASQYGIFQKMDKPEVNSNIEALLTNIAFNFNDLQNIVKAFNSDLDVTYFKKWYNNELLKTTKINTQTTYENILPILLNASLKKEKQQALTIDTIKILNVENGEEGVKKLVDSLVNNIDSNNLELNIPLNNDKLKKSIQSLDLAQIESFLDYRNNQIDTIHTLYTKSVFDTVDTSALKKEIATLIQMYNEDDLNQKISEFKKDAGNINQFVKFVTSKIGQGTSFTQISNILNSTKTIENLIDRSYLASKNFDFIFNKVGKLIVSNKDGQYEDTGDNGFNEESQQEERIEQEREENNEDGQYEEDNTEKNGEERQNTFHDDAYENHYNEVELTYPSDEESEDQESSDEERVSQGSGGQDVSQGSGGKGSGGKGSGGQGSGGQDVSQGSGGKGSGGKGGDDKKATSLKNKTPNTKLQANQVVKLQTKEEKKEELPPQKPEKKARKFALILAGSVVSAGAAIAITILALKLTLALVVASAVTSAVIGGLSGYFLNKAISKNDNKDTKSSNVVKDVKGSEKSKNQSKSKSQGKDVEKSAIVTKSMHSNTKGIKKLPKSNSVPLNNLISSRQVDQNKLG